jgi:uncharacterized protein
MKMNCQMKSFTVKAQALPPGISMPFSRALMLFVLLLTGVSSLKAQKGELFPAKPEPAVYVHDYSGWLTPQQKASLEQKLIAYWDTTSTQIVVMIRPDIGDYDKSSYAFELGNRWGVGTKDKDNGVVMLIKSEAPDRGVFIATGYGAEGALPDITAGRIIRNTMAPFFRQNQYYEGINAGLDEIISALAGEYTQSQEQEGANWKAILVIVFILLMFMVILGGIIYKVSKKGKWITHTGSGRNRNDRWGGGDWWIGGGGSSGGWGGGGGSWGGGGGSFGGGSFGGGGAGGDW